MRPSAHRPRRAPLGPGPGPPGRPSADFVALAAAVRAQSRDLMERCRILHEHARAAVEQRTRLAHTGR